MSTKKVSKKLNFDGPNLNLNELNEKLINSFDKPEFGINRLA